MRLALAFILGLVLAVPARANEDPDTEVARKHFNSGRTFYDSGEYEKALSEFEAAKRVRPHPALDYNIARCLDRMERYHDAIEAYQRYLVSKPADAEDIRERVKLLYQRLATEPPKKEPPPPTQPPPMVVEHETLIVPVEGPPPKSHKKTVAIVLGVLAGAVVIGAGVAIGLLVKPTTDSATPDSIGGPHRATP